MNRIVLLVGGRRDSFSAGGKPDIELGEKSYERVPQKYYPLLNNIDKVKCIILDADREALSSLEK